MADPITGTGEVASPVSHLIGMGRVPTVEKIRKLQPNRTIQLRGFDDLGASAALHSPTEDSFKVSGIFRDPADFAVLILYDADNFYEHPRLKYLPDFDFSGLTLTFDVHTSGLMPLDSPKYPTIDWPYLDVIRPDGTTAKIHLFSQAEQTAGTYTCAGASFVIEDNSLQPYDRLTLWYQNFAFDYIVPPPPEDLPTAAEVAAALAAQINGVNWGALGVLLPLQAETDGATLRILSVRPGEDGNMIRMYAVAKNERLRTTEPVAVFQGGSSDATWRVTLDFSSLGIPEIRQMWLTFAPALANGAAMPDTEWEAVFTNWNLSGPEATRTLLVAGPGSVRIEEDDSWCTYQGGWAAESGFYSGGFARRTSTLFDTLTVFYSCRSAHDLYIGTSLYSDRGVAGVSLDTDAETELDCFLDAEPAVVTRRKMRTAVPPGEHTVTIRLLRGGPFYFDFLEAAVPTHIPDPLPVIPNVSPALDYSTDHTYKLPPARILWMFDQLGYAGPMNEYIGVFWWNQRKRVDAVVPSVSVTFAGQFLPDDQVLVSIGGQACGKTVFPNEDAALIARHFACFINETFVGVWAAVADNVLAITARSPRPAYFYTFQAWKEPGGESTGTVDWTGSLQDGDPGRWVVDPLQTPALNRGAREWHRDFFDQCCLRGREVTVAASMELVNPPADFGARFAEGSVVETSVGFGSLISTHCAFSSPMLQFQKGVYKDLAGLMRDTGLIPSLQFGESCWRYYTNFTQNNLDGGMGYYDDETQAAALAALGRPLHTFTSPEDDPQANAAADAAFLRNRLREHVAALAAHIRDAHPAAKLEVLFPFDVNHPTPAGVHQLGGRLNRFVNLPAEWEHKATSGLTRMKIEALDFGAWSRDLELSRAAVFFGIGLNWPKDSLRHLLPVFQPGYAWRKECQTALGEGVPAVILWSFDHICLFGIDPDPAPGRASSKRF
jgi:hypothetical protein